MHLHGLCHPTHQKPIRYTKKIVVNQAISANDNCCDLLNKHTPTVTSSTNPAPNIKCPNEKPVMGSAAASNLVALKAVQILAPPVIASIVAALNRKHDLTVFCMDSRYFTILDV